MSGAACRAAFIAAPDGDRAKTLDQAFPNCACEPWSLTESNGPGIDGSEVIARLLTSPDAYDEAASALVTSKLTHIYSFGMSVIRQGAADAEIRQTVNDLLTGGAEQRKLVGAVVMTATQYRVHVSDDGTRWFGVYATDEGDKQHHGDILGTTASKRQQQKRRHLLAEVMLPLIVQAADVDDLVTKLRASGI